MKKSFDLPAYHEKISFSKAELIYFEPIYIPIPFYDSTGGPFNTNAIGAWLRIYDQDGVMGECACTEEMARTVLPHIMNGETKTYEEWWDYVYWINRNRGFSSEAQVELGRLDFAMHDIMAKRAGLPLHRFLGATRDWVNVYGSGCGTGLTRKQMEDEVNLFLKKGYKVIKMKAATNRGMQLDDDVERVAIVRDLVGPDIQIAVDVNQLFDAEEALAFANRIAKYDIRWYEEPVHSHDIAELKKLCDVCPIDVSMGESMRSHYIYPAYVMCGVKHLQPCLSNVAGIQEWMLVRDLAKENNLLFTSGGIAHQTASVVATCDEDTMVEYLYPIQHYQWEIMDKRPEEKGGRFILPEEPGGPMSPDWELLEKHNLIMSKQYYYPDTNRSVPILR